MTTEDGAMLPEGAETAPPGTRAAGIVRWGLIALMAVVAIASVVHATGLSLGGREHATGGEQRYYCPMHPQIVQDRPGDCPICNMTLVPKPAANVLASNTMTPALATDGGAGGKYYCPMHPEVSSDDPNATCAKCGGMKLLPRPTNAGGSDDRPLASDVPGLVPVELGQQRTQLMGMRTARVTREPLAGALRATGVVTASERGLAQINTRFAGYIEKLLVSETGRRVRRGQALATIYSPEVLRVQQELLTARRWDRPAHEAGATPEHAPLADGLADDARRRLELLGISRQEIEQVLRSGKAIPALAIRSPVDGYVISKTAVEGGVVQPGTPLFEIADLSRVWVIAEVYESEVARVRVGQPARLDLAAFPGETFTGRVTFVHPTLDAASRTLRLRLEFKNRPGNSGPKLRPGMYGNVALDVPAASALSVPVEALVDTGDVQYVFLAREGGRFEPRRVTVGARGSDRVQVLSGVQEGDTVVTTANFLIDSESRLRAAVEGRTGELPDAGGAAPPAASSPPGHRH